MSFKISSLVLLLQFILSFAAAQPANDDCTYSQLIVLSPGGTACISSTSINATADGVAPNGCNSPTGGNEVWFSFVATGISNTITVYPTGGQPAQTLSVSVYNGGCGSGLNQCNTAASVNDTAQVAFPSAQGTQFWFEVSGLTADGDFTVCITSFDSVPPPPYSAGVGDSCATAIPICTKSPFTTLGPSAFSNSGTYLSCYAFGMLNDMWFRFDVGKTGTLEWLAQPNGAIELDWELLDVTAGCPGNVVACNFVVGALPGLPTGMSSTATGNCATDQICFPAIVTAGSSYVLHINNYTGMPGIGFSILWGGTFEMYPYPDFTINTPTGCPPLNTGFTDLSYGASTYNWNFGNGNTSALNNPPAQVYNTPGTYAVTLTVTGGNGCAQTFAQQLTVQSNPPSSAFSAAYSSVCIGAVDTLYYTGNASPLATYNWNIAGATLISGSGQGPLVVQWNTSGIKNVTLDVIENGCTSATTQLNITVNALPTSTFSLPANGCEGDTIMVTYTGTAAPTANYFWNFGNSFPAYFNGADTALIYWNAAMNDSVYLIVVENGCFSAITSSLITITATPDAPFTLIDSACTSNLVTVSYTGTAPGTATYNWSFGTGSANPGGTVQGPQQVTWNAPGYQPVSLTVTDNGCTSNATFDSIYIINTPTASFTVSDKTLCDNQNTTITFNGTASPNSVYNWNFTGATIVSGSGAGPYVINYAAQGLNYITLTVSEGACVSQQYTDSIVTASTPTSNAGSNVVYCNGDSMQIGIAPTPGFNYQWTPLAGLSSNTIANPYVVLTNVSTNPLSQNYVVTTSNLFCSSTDTVNAIVNPRQAAVINTASTGQCINGNSFNFNCAPPNVTGATYNWSFGSAASPSIAVTPSVSGVTYNTTGQFLATLITTTAGCANDTDTVSISIFEMPNAAFKADTQNGCPPLFVNFINNSTTAPGSTYYWDFGNGQTSTLETPSMLFDSSGIYPVLLIVTSPDGCVDSILKPNFIKATKAPVADFTVEPLIGSLVNPNITFTNNTLYDDSCYFDLGDGNIKTGCQDFAHAYNAVGTYTIMLVAFSAGGCSDTTYRTVEIRDYYTIYIPKAFTPNDDLVNDVWEIKGLGIVEYELEVYNRRGQLVYISNNMLEPWNGKYLDGSQDTQQDNYVYIIKTRDTLGKRHSYRGNVVVIR